MAPTSDVEDVPSACEAAEDVDVMDSCTRDEEGTCEVKRGVFIREFERSCDVGDAGKDVLIRENESAGDVGKDAFIGDMDSSIGDTNRLYMSGDGDRPSGGGADTRCGEASRRPSSPASCRGFMSGSCITRSPDPS